MATLFELAARIQAADGAEEMLLIVAKATLILLIARVLLAAMPRASAATRHLVATSALVGVAMMPILTVITPAWNIVVERATAPAEPVAAEKPIGATGDEAGEPARATAAAPAPTGTRASFGTAVSLVRATGVLAEEPLSAMSRAANVVRGTWKGMIVVGLGIVSLLMLGQMLLGIVGVWFVAKHAEEVTHDAALLELDNARDALQLERDVRLLRSSRISVPVLWGFVRPVLLLPTDVVTWPAERLRVVLLHELAHLKRFDGISLILTRIAACVFWYHPLAWSLERAGRNDCERACDDLVLAGGTKPSEYADHLLAIARSMPTFDPFRSVTLAMSRKTQLEGRLLSILQPHVVRRVFSGRKIAVACAVAVTFIIPLSALRLTAQPSEQQKQQQIAENKSKSTTPSASAAESKSDANVTVTPDIEALEDYFLTKLGKYDKRLDKLARDPKNGEQWYERAYNLYRNDRFADAADAFNRAAELNYRKETSLYNAACSYALISEVDNALEALDQAIAAGWDDMEKIAEDSDFDPIRSDPRFARALQDTTGEIATRRLRETMRRYDDLKQGRGSNKDAVADAVADGVKGAVEGAVRGAVAAAQAINPDVELDFHFDDIDWKGNDSDWYEVGLDLLRLRRFEESIHAFERSIESNDKVSSALYNIACAYSLQGDARRGMTYLEKAVEAGFGGDEKLQNDPDIALLRRQSGFDELRKRAKLLEMRGCCDRDGDNDNAWVADNWSEAVEFHRNVAKRYPGSGRAWFNLGYTALQAREFDTGIDAFHRAIQLNHRVGTSSYNIACGYSLRGDKDAAFQWLNKARDAGFELANYMDDDEDLDALRDDPRFDKMYLQEKAKQRAKNKARNRMKADKHKQKNDSD